MLIPMTPAGLKRSGLPRAARAALVVSGTEKGRNALKFMLEGSAYHPAAFAGSGGEARRSLLSGSFDAVIINCPLPDEFGHELALHAAEDGRSVLLVVKSEMLDEVSAQVGGAGVLTVPKPVSRAMFNQALSLMNACQRQVEQVRKEIGRLRLKLDETKLVCRAKCVLVECLGMTEAEAHRAIEKRAMDSQASRLAVAGKIIREYEENGKAGVTLE